MTGVLGLSLYLILVVVGGYGIGFRAFLIQLINQDTSFFFKL
jgi:hypothetical protein